MNSILNPFFGALDLPTTQKFDANHALDHLISSSTFANLEIGKIEYQCKIIFIHESCANIVD